ncbi:hypothetical protein ACROYT_G024807 [Oculina patagonica]
MQIRVLETQAIRVYTSSLLGTSQDTQAISHLKELNTHLAVRWNLASAPVKPRWWRRYVDDSNACLKSESIRVFHSNLNSINPHIQCTIEMPTTGAEGQTIAFLDTSNTVSASDQVEVGVYRKPTHTNKCLAFESHSPAQSKRAVVKTLMDRAKYLPSTSERKQSEKQQVIGDLKVNGYLKVSSIVALFRLNKPYSQKTKKVKRVQGVTLQSLT